MGPGLRRDDGGDRRRAASPAALDAVPAPWWVSAHEHRRPPIPSLVAHLL